MTKQRNLSTFLGRTPRGAIMGVFCTVLIVLLAACGGGSPTGPSSATSPGGATTSGQGLGSTGNNISGKTILFEIKSGASNFFFVPAVNGRRRQPLSLASIFRSNMVMMMMRQWLIR